MVKMKIVSKLIDGVVRCTRCNKKLGECNCWSICNCGWLIEKGFKCGNPKCNNKNGGRNENNPITRRS